MDVLSTYTSLFNSLFPNLFFRYLRFMFIPQQLAGYEPVIRRSNCLPKWCRQQWHSVYLYTLGGSQAHCGDLSLVRTYSVDWMWMCKSAFGCNSVMFTQVVNCNSRSGPFSCPSFRPLPVCNNDWLLLNSLSLPVQPLPMDKAKLSVAKWQRHCPAITSLTGLC